MVIDHGLDPPGHGVAEASQVVPAEVLSPHLADGLLQLGNWGDVLSCVFVFMKFQAFSMGFKSGELPGQSITSQGLSFKKFLILFEAWQGVPSCRKWALRCISMNSRRWSSRTCWYLPPFIVNPGIHTQCLTENSQRQFAYRFEYSEVEYCKSEISSRILRSSGIWHFLWRHAKCSYFFQPEALRICVKESARA